MVKCSPKGATPDLTEEKVPPSEEFSFLNEDSGEGVAADLLLGGISWRKMKYL